MRERDRLKSKVEAAFKHREERYRAIPIVLAPQMWWEVPQFSGEGLDKAVEEADRYQKRLDALRAVTPKPPETDEEKMELLRREISRCKTFLRRMKAT